jgi:hypothetical protein
MWKTNRKNGERFIGCSDYQRKTKGGKCIFTVSALELRDDGEKGALRATIASLEEKLKAKEAIIAKLTAVLDSEEEVEDAEGNESGEGLQVNAQ